MGETPQGTTVNLRAAFTAGNATEKYAVNSKQVLETAFRDALQKQIGGMTAHGSKGQERPKEVGRPLFLGQCRPRGRRVVSAAARP